MNYSGYLPPHLRRIQHGPGPAPDRTSAVPLASHPSTASNGLPTASTVAAASGNTAAAGQAAESPVLLDSPACRLDIPRPVRVSHAGPPVDPTVRQLGKVYWKRANGSARDRNANWITAPSIEHIQAAVSPHLHHAGFASKDFDIVFLAEGNLHKVYVVSEKASGKEAIIRVALPVDPYYHLMSEVASISYIHEHTSIPVPRVYAYDPSAENTMGLEWMLMERVSGLPIAEVWKRRTALPTKLKVASRLADWVDQMCRLRFDEIGSLYFRDDGEEIYLGRPIDWRFTQEHRGKYDVPRGPFSSILDSYTAQLQARLAEVEDPLQLVRANLERGYRALDPKLMALAKKHFDGASYSLEDLRLLPSIIRRLLAILPHILPSSTLGPGETCLMHRSLHSHNIFFKETATGEIELTCILDWEKLTAHPLVSFGKYPILLGEGVYGFDTEIKAAFRKRLEELNSPWLEVLNKEGVGDKWVEKTEVEEYRQVLRTIGSGRTDLLEAFLVKMERKYFGWHGDGTVKKLVGVEEDEAWGKYYARRRGSGRGRGQGRRK